MRLDPTGVNGHITTDMDGDSPTTDMIVHTINPSDLLYDDTIPKNLSSDGLARSPIVEAPGRASCLHKMVTFCDRQRLWTRGRSLDSFWGPEIAEFFDPAALLLLDFIGESQWDRRTAEIRGDAIPRYFKSVFDAGAEALNLMMATPYELILQSGASVVDCPRAAEIIVFPHCRLYSEGHLRVTFNECNRIVTWEFSSRNHEELYHRAGLERGLPPPYANKYGLSPLVTTFMDIACSMNGLEKEIDVLVDAYHASGQPLSRLTLNGADDNGIPQRLLRDDRASISELLGGNGDNRLVVPTQSLGNEFAGNATHNSLYVQQQQRQQEQQQQQQQGQRQTQQQTQQQRRQERQQLEQKQRQQQYLRGNQGQQAKPREPMTSRVIGSHSYVNGTGPMITNGPMTSEQMIQVGNVQDQQVVKKAKPIKPKTMMNPASSRGMMTDRSPGKKALERKNQDSSSPNTKRAIAGGKRKLNGTKNKTKNGMNKGAKNGVVKIKQVTVTPV